MLHNASEKHGELKITTWTVSLSHSVFMNLQGLTLLILEEWWGYLTAKLIVLDSSDMLRRKKMKCIDYTLNCKLIDRTMISTTTKTATKKKQKTNKMETNLPISLGSSSSLFSSRSSTLSFFSSPTPRGSLYHWSENKITLTDKYCIQSAIHLSSTNDTVYSFQILIY